MASITDNITYLNLSKLAEFNETMPIPEITNFQTFQDGFLAVFSNYPIIQWTTSIILFIILFLIIRKMDFIILTEIQITFLVSFILIVFNSLLLIMEIYTITQPLQLFFIVWLISIISIISARKQ